jgi:hypothetical protein
VPVCVGVGVDVAVLVDEGVADGVAVVSADFVNVLVQTGNVVPVL